MVYCFINNTRVQLNKLFFKVKTRFVQIDQRFLGSREYASPVKFRQTRIVFGHRIESMSRSFTRGFPKLWMEDLLWLLKPRRLLQRKPLPRRLLRLLRKLLPRRPLPRRLLRLLRRQLPRRPLPRLLRLPRRPLPRRPLPRRLRPRLLRLQRRPLPRKLPPRLLRLRRLAARNAQNKLTPKKQQLYLAELQTILVNDARFLRFSHFQNRIAINQLQSCFFVSRYTVDNISGILLWGAGITRLFRGQCPLPGMIKLSFVRPPSIFFRIEYNTSIIFI